MAEPNRRCAPLELWAGLECSVCRIGDHYYDQLERGGHAARPEDIDLIAGLGVRTVRYPILWERVAPNGPETADWSWADDRLERLRRFNIRPVVGLVHHGGGPPHTSLVDPSFPIGLAAFAGAVARRYPWIDAYTPVNEPLTTARFGGLYGHWHPHGRDPLTFARALLNQCRAVVLAMRAVREVNPAARLVQTDDLGKTVSTTALKYQADFENERRWLTWDLLCGRVDAHSPMWGYLRWVGVDESEITWFLENPCPPDLIGVNYYLTSERFLDERRDRYPAWAQGGNGRHIYADVEVVRVRAGAPAGVAAMLRETWNRYQLPIAVTETHLGCTREEQLRWFAEVWGAAQTQRERGIDVRAVTAWSLFGAYDWNSLMTRPEGRYEPGAFDVRGPRPRPTALVGLLREAAAGQRLSHPVLASTGWWRRPQRFLYPPSQPHSDRPVWEETMPLDARRARPLLIAGATGTLGQAFAILCKRRGLEFRLLSRAEMDIADPNSVASALAHHRPWAVVNAAGFARVNEAERDPRRCFRENADGPAILAAACAGREIKLLTFSTNLVFDGRVQRPYQEDDAPAPLSIYGHSKAEAERRVLRAHPSALVVRTSACFGPWDRHNFVTRALRTLARGEPFVADDDAVVSATYIPDLVQACLDLLIDYESGLWHLANPGAVTRLELARRAAATAGVDTTALLGASMQTRRRPASRPLFSALDSRYGVLLPPLDDALARYCGEREADLASPALTAFSSSP